MFSTSSLKACEGDNWFWSVVVSLAVLMKSSVHSKFFSHFHNQLKKFSCPPAAPAYNFSYLQPFLDVIVRCRISQVHSCARNLHIEDENLNLSFFVAYCCTKINVARD